MTKLMRLGEVLETVQVSRTTLYRLIRNGVFPSPIRPSSNRMIAWRDTDIEKWIESRTEEIVV